MVLQVNNLSTSFATEAGTIRVVDDVSFSVDRGECLGLVGESGCGKSITALSIMRLLPQPAGQIDNGEILFGDQDLRTLPAQSMRGIRGNRIAMIFQEPMTALNPVHKIGKQLQEPFRLHRPDMSKHDMTKEAIRLLTEVGIPSPEKRLNEYPHQLSGGMRQRVMIAMALALQPELLIADEPTTALDVTIQAQILGLIKELQDRHGTAVIFITHDLGVIAETSDKVAVMYAGRIAEYGPVAPLYDCPAHPYSRGLLNAIPRLSDTPRSTLNAIPGNVPALNELSSACRFATRCELADDECRRQKPALRTLPDERQVACIHPYENGSHA